MKDLAQRAIACKHWKWMVGMVDMQGNMVIDAQPEMRAEVLNCYNEVAHLQKDALPDLTDPATLGCLLHLVREAWGDAGIAATIVRDARDGDYWHLVPVRHKYPAFASTEADALVAALEAAP